MTCVNQRVMPIVDYAFLFEMVRLPRLKLKKCLFLWLKLSWIKGSQREHMQGNLKGNPTFLGNHNTLANPFFAIIMTVP